MMFPRDQYLVQSYSTGLSMTWMNGWNEPSASLLMGERLGGMADTPEDAAAVQQDLDGLENCAERNPMRFNKGKCKVLHLGGRTSSTSTGWEQESRSAEKDLGVLVDDKLTERAACPCSWEGQ